VSKEFNLMAWGVPIPGRIIAVIGVVDIIIIAILGVIMDRGGDLMTRTRMAASAGEEPSTASPANRIENQTLLMLHHAFEGKTRKGISIEKECNACATGLTCIPLSNRRSMTILLSATRSPSL
jgi:hypothetical protein